MRGSLVILSKLIASLTFQISINPSSGVRSENATAQQGCSPEFRCKVGTSVLDFS
ncbi:hypothetical protein RYX36_031120, partial [Vicia faba]